MSGNVSKFDNYISENYNKYSKIKKINTNLHINLNSENLGNRVDYKNLNKKYSGKTINNNFGSGRNINTATEIVEFKFDSDEELQKIVSDLKKQILIIGIGGAGNNTISKLQEIGLEYAETLAVNTDAHDLYYTLSDKKLLIGKEITGGLGAGNDWKIGEQAAESDIERIKDVVKRKVIFITCGLGGGTGTGASHIFAREAKKAGALVIVICTLPFKMEGVQKTIVANQGLKKISKYADSIIPIRNEKLLLVHPDIPILKGFKIIDEVLIKSVKAVVDVVSKCGFINLDLADICNVLGSNHKNHCIDQQKMGFIGMSEVFFKDIEAFIEKYSKNNTNNLSENNNENLLDKIFEEQALKALENPLLDIDPKNITSCIISISANQNITLRNLNKILGTISSMINSNAKIKIGAIINPKLDKIQISIIGQTGITPSIFQAKNIENEEIFNS
ncbi:MAG: cell division protein FtsZ [Promethearchaeota archaeon]